MGNIHFCLDNTTWILGKPSYQPSQMVLQCCNETTYGHFSIEKKPLVTNGDPSF